jgi:hypothetical protein
VHSRQKKTAAQKKYCYFVISTNKCNFNTDNEIYAGYFAGTHFFILSAKMRNSKSKGVASA